MGHKFDPADAERLLRPERLETQNPSQIFNAMGLGPDMTLADIGAGPGYFTLPAAAWVGSAGLVYALDIEPEMLQRLEQRLETNEVFNVRCLNSQESALPLPDESVDRALLANVLHEAIEPVTLLREVLRILRPGGRLAVIEWDPAVTEGGGPPTDERLAAKQVKALLKEAGFKDVTDFEVGPTHYGVLTGEK